MPLTPKEIVELLNVTTPDLSARIGAIDRHLSSKKYDIEGRFFYVRFRGDEPAIDELIDIAHTRIVNFCIPKSRINEVIRKIQEDPNRLDDLVKLTTEARDLFIKTNMTSCRSGELGEILLYMLLESILHAPIIACKMYLKTSSQMPIHGTDGIHMGAEGNKLIIYWGESKLHKEMNSAINDIFQSISHFSLDPKSRDNEIRLIKSNLDTCGLDEDSLDEIKKYFNPYVEESNRLIDCYACFAGFDSDLYEKAKNIENTSAEEAFCSLYKNEFNKIFNYIERKLYQTNITKLKFTYFVLPFPSVDAAREKFQFKLWGK